jgi:hypothetical protein
VLARLAIGRLRPLVRDEGGQTAIAVLLVFLGVFALCALSLDAGFWYFDHRTAQNQADAAAQAGALQLQLTAPPVGSSTASVITAVQRSLQQNHANCDATSGTCPDLVVCPGQTSAPAILDTSGDGLYDSVQICVRRKAPALFAGLAGIESAYVSSGVVQATAFRAVVPLDVVLVMDRTASMSASDMTAAKTAADSILGILDTSEQQVALGTIGPSSTDTTCHGADSPAHGLAADSLSGLLSWIPVPLRDDYKTSDGSLNTSSLLVKTIDCLDNPGGVNTNIGEPTKKATEYLAACGRSDVNGVKVKQGIILETDGTANQNFGDTSFAGCSGNEPGFLSCNPLTIAAVTSGAGHNNGFEITPGNACADGGGVAQDMNSGTGGSNNSCTNAGNDAHDFRDYNVSVPAGLNVAGIQVRLDASVDSSSSTSFLCVELSWDGGNHWTAAKQTPNLTTSQATYILGTTNSSNYDLPNDTWGHSGWNASQLNNTNFRVRVIDVTNNHSRDFSLDWVGVRVAYSDPIGACHYAATQADAAKAAGIEIFTIAYGDALSGQRCADTSGPWHNQLSTALLAYMATNSADNALGGGCNTTAKRAAENSDGDHFLCAANSDELKAVFQSAAASLGSGIAITR